MSSQPPWAVVRCGNETCPVFGVVRRLRLEPAGPGFVRVPPLRCTRCGHTAQDVPAGGGDMPKITVHGGASVADAEAAVAQAEAAGAAARVAEAQDALVDAHRAAEPPAVPEPAEPEAVEPGDDDQDEAEAFDPATHTVVEVNAYLETAGDDERARVLAAETAGKHRLGVLNTWGAP